VFGIGELGRREIGAREIEKKLHISPVWQTKEIREREFKRMGPTHFRLSAKLQRNSRERFVSNFILVANYRKEKKHIK
jgi:hypothetical protein